MNTPSAPLHDVDAAPSIASFVLLGTIGVISFIVQPALVQGFVTELGVAEPVAVGLAGIEMAGVALATILLSIFGPRLNWRQMTAAGLLVALSGNFGSALLANGPAFPVARFVAGFGHGMVISLSFTFVGLTRRTDRNLAVYLTALLGYGALGLWAAPIAFDRIGLPGIFLFFAATCLAGLLTLRWLPRSAAARLEPSAHALQLAPPLLASALAGVLAYNLAIGIAWAILFLVGMAAGLGEQPVANALFWSQVVAVFGALAAVFLADAFGRVRPIVFGIVGGALCIALLYGRPGYGAFLVAVCGFNLAWNMVLPFILGAIGDMDERGRMMAPAIAMQMTGLGLGPILSASLIEGGRFAAVETLCIAAFAASIVLLLVPILAQRRAAA